MEDEIIEDEDGGGGGDDGGDFDLESEELKERCALADGSAVDSP